MLEPSTTLEELPRYWQRKISNLRKECAESRVTLREARDEIAVLRAELAALRK